ncbi:uncharacterized protein LOC111920009 [Lactuca sativa]|uniref:uncharacterized protein LOC111920009 n=1 Tax=Lactuca sativa TaxID=4236 RepID=UPI000CD84313|nr:uncharacterized protein LOC111920009 [Lactuca sativa]
MAKLPKFAKDVMSNRKELEKASIIVLNELCSTIIIKGLPIKMGDLGQLTLPCEFGNMTSINALADLGASINLMPYSFYQKLKLPKFQDTRMTIRMSDHSTTYPQGIIEDLLVKVGKFVFLVDCVVLDTKEDEYLPIVLGRPFLSTARVFVDIHDSKITLCVDDDAITFEMSHRGNHEEPKDEVSKMDSMEVDCDELVAIKMMMEKLKV